MFNKISSMLDKVANSLESNGLIKEAFELDKIADQLDKISGSNFFRQPGHPSRGDLDVRDEFDLAGQVEDNGGEMPYTEEEIVSAIKKGDIEVSDLIKAGIASKSPNGHWAFLTHKVLAALFNRTHPIDPDLDLSYLLYLGQEVDFNKNDFPIAENVLALAKDRVRSLGIDKFINKMQSMIDSSDKKLRDTHGFDTPLDHRTRAKIREYSV